MMTKEVKINKSYSFYLRLMSTYTTKFTQIEAGKSQLVGHCSPGHQVPREDRALCPTERTKAVLLPIEVSLRFIKCYVNEL